MLRTLEWKKSTDRIYSFHKTRLHKGRGRLRVGHSKRGHERDSVKRLWPFERFWSQSAGSLSIYFKIMPSHISTIYRDLLDLVKILLCSMKVYSFIYRLHFLIRIAIVPKDLTGAKICQRFSIVSFARCCCFDVLSLTCLGVKNKRLPRLEWPLFCVGKVIMKLPIAYRKVNS